MGSCNFTKLTHTKYADNEMEVGMGGVGGWDGKKEKSEERGGGGVVGVQYFLHLFHLGTGSKQDS